MIHFIMAKINVPQFAILSDTVPQENLTYTVELGFKCATEAKRLGCDFLVEFSHDDNPLIKLSVFCEFDILPDDWDRQIADGRLTIRKNDLGFFANQTVGVARGVLFCKTEGTPFSQFIIPPINLVSLITDDFSIEVDQELTH